MEMGKNILGWEVDENFCFSAQAHDQFQTIEASLPQMGQQVTEAVKSIMQPLIPEVVQAVRLQCAQEFEAFVPVLVEAVRSQCAQEFRAFIPKMVEEVKQMVHPSGSRSPPHQAESSASRSLKLQFAGTLPDQLVTMNDIQDDGASLRVELCDSSGSRIEVGHESSVKIKIFVLDGDFEVEDRDYWTEEDFNKSVVQPRKDKGPLLRGKGNCEFSLSKGVAIVSNISFTDNSSKSTKNGYFRLGAQVVKGLPPGSIREAVSRPFRVKDRRGQAYQKHKTPSLEDEIWCLQNIADKGKNWERLVCAKVHNVKDFLQLYHTDEMELQNIAQIRGKKWRETVVHAKSCLLTNEHYRYCNNEEGVLDLVLDCVFNIVSVTLNGQGSQHYDNLNASQKDLVNKERRKAYEKRNELPKICTPTNQISVRVEPICSSAIPQMNMQYSDAGGLEMLSNFNYGAPGVVTSHPGGHVDQSQDTSYLEFINMDAFMSADFSPNTASTSHTQAVIHGTSELVTKCCRARWNSVRLRAVAVVKFKILLELSVRKSPRAPKRQRLA